jgi:hypothetical protein
MRFTAEKKKKTTTNPDVVRAKCREAMFVMENSPAVLNVASQYHGIKVVARVLLHLSESSAIEATLRSRSDYKKLKKLIAAFGPCEKKQQEE